MIGWVRSLNWRVCIFDMASSTFVNLTSLCSLPPPVERRQNLVMHSAEKTGAIVSNMFPKSIQDRLLKEQESSSAFSSEKNRVKSFLTGDANTATFYNEIDTKPIADLFPHATVLYTDLTGFTSWSSSRAPDKVFILLQTLYQAFDVIAKNHKVFKVETTGDSYVAVTGVPNHQERHAVLMVRFAFECLQKLSVLTKKLETVLGPDTADLGMRVGIHSGPVTAGVLKGDKARFQLFGDTVNTAARLEQTGQKNMIQTSQATAKLLREAGRGHWLTPRTASAAAKGKGILETFWVIPRAVDQAGNHASFSRETINTERRGSTSSHGANIDHSNDTNVDRRSRSVDWMCNLIIQHLREIEARRQTLGVKNADSPESLVYRSPAGKTCLDEVTECIHLPKFDSKIKEVAKVDPSSVMIDELVIKQLRDYVTTMASMYRNNPFHNFDHASHVTMA